MKRKILIYSMIVLTFIACNKNTFNVDVEMRNANGKVIYLQKIIDNEFVSVDSAIVENNKVHFDVEKDGDTDALHILVEGWRRAVPFFADNEDVEIKGDYNNYNDIYVKSSVKLSQDYLNVVSNDLKTADDNRKKEMIMSMARNTTQGCHRIVNPYLIYRYKWLFNLHELRDLMKYFENEKSSYLSKLNEYIAFLEKTEIGKPYIDFTLKNIEDKPVSLSSLVGNHELVMVDFWASWCPDCRVENPNIVSVYNDFKDKGLEIISVSLDNDRTAWHRGIKEDNLSWKNHVSELKGWNCTAATDYGVAFIPQNFLIDKNGIIVAKNLNGNDLRMFVENYLR